MIKDLQWLTGGLGAAEGQRYFGSEALGPHSGTSSSVFLSVLRFPRTLSKGLDSWLGLTLGCLLCWSCSWICSWPVSTPQARVLPSAHSVLCRLLPAFQLCLPPTVDDYLYFVCPISILSMHTWVWVFVGTRRRCWISQNLNYRWLSTSQCVCWEQNLGLL